MNQNKQEKARQNYLKYRDYFLNYQKKNEPSNRRVRKYAYCVLCGLPNQNKRFKKTCSLSCSLNWKRASFNLYLRTDYRKRVVA